MTINITSRVTLRKVNGDFIPSKGEKFIKVLGEPYKVKVIGENATANKMALDTAKAVIKEKHKNYLNSGEEITASVNYTLPG